MSKCEKMGQMCHFRHEKMIFGVIQPNPSVHSSLVTSLANYISTYENNLDQRMWCNDFLV